MRVNFYYDHSTFGDFFKGRVIRYKLASSIFHQLRGSSLPLLTEVVKLNAAYFHSRCTIMLTVTLWSSSSC